MSGKLQKKLEPDGPNASLTIRLPALVHGLGFIAVAGLAATAYLAASSIGVVLGIAGVTIALYTAFYTRQAIVTLNKRAKFLDTVHFSRHISEGDLFRSRDRLGNQFQYYYSQTGSSDNEQVRTDAATERLRDELVKQMDERQGNCNGDYDPDKTLVDDARKIADFFEDLAVGVKFDVYDEQMSRALLRGLLIDSYKSIEGFIRHQRSQKGTQTAYVHFEDLYNRWR